MSDNALAVFQSAEDALRGGQYEAALTNYLAVIRGVPEYWRARFRVADTLLNLKAPQYSLEIYKNIAIHAIKAGQPLWGLAAIKMAAALDRSQHDLVHVVASLYGRDSDRIDRNIPPRPPRRLKATDPVGDVSFLSGQNLIETAGTEAAATDDIADYPAKLPAIPLFSFLDEDAFGSVLEMLNLRRHVKGQRIIEEGQPGNAFYIIAEGDVMVTRAMKGRDVNLARLHRGAVFGEMALVSNAPRTATVTANDDCDLLELKRTTLESQGAQLASVTRALHDFTHERFLTNLTATSPIFKPIPRSLRAEIVRKFQDFPVDPGDELIAEGEEGQGLFMILKGQIEVHKKSDDGAVVTLATLKEGDVFGEISLLQSSPTTASCVAKTAAELLFLPRAEFHSTMARHPELKEELAKITAERLRATEDKLRPDEEGYILIEDDDLIML